MAHPAVSPGASGASRYLSGVLYGVLLAFVAIATHNFFAYINHYPYWSIDDGLAVVSTSWLQTGRYGDPSVPVEQYSGFQRYNGFFLYGPWWFAAGSAITWLFGFSIQALRSIHLIAALSLAFVGSRVFTGLRGAIATTVIGVSAAYAVVQIQWPMVRPDGFVTLFAAGLIWSAVTATRTGRLRDWFLCGLAAGCGALSHLLGATLVPASLVALVAGVAIRGGAGESPLRIPGSFVVPVAALVTGWIVSALMFYGSFGFRFSEHFIHVMKYRSAVTVNTTVALNSTGPLVVWAEHYRIASSGVPGWFIAVVAVAFIMALALIARALWSRSPAAHETIALLVPGCAIFALYVGSLGFYPNFHTGYVMLPQLIGVWIVASTAYVILGETGDRRWGGLVVSTAAIVLIVVASRSAYALSRTDDDPRLALTRSWIAISSYIDEVLGPVPEGAIAWGSGPLAAEGSQRIQLISFDSALWLMSRIPAPSRPTLAPDYLLWGHPASQDAVVSQFATPEQNPLKLLPLVLPNTEFLLTSIVSGAPYGATRVYQRRLPDMAPARMPAISVWDATQQRWLHETTPVDGVAWASATGSLRVTKGARHWSRPASDVLVADLPAGWYLFRITVTGTAAAPQLLTASTGPVHDYVGGDLPPAVDVAARLSSEPIYLLRHHDGGSAGLNLYADDGVARLGAVETFRLSGLADYRRSREQLAEQPLPAWSTWLPDTSGGVATTTEGSTLRVTGNSSQWGYQLVSPRIEVTPGADVSIWLPVTVTAGRVCTGVLDEHQQWLVRPADQTALHRFQAGANRAVFVVVSNCNVDAASSVASRFTVSEARVAVLGDRWYVDRLMREFEKSRK